MTQGAAKGAADVGLTLWSPSMLLFLLAMVAAQSVAVEPPSPPSPAELAPDSAAPELPAADMPPVDADVDVAAAEESLMALESDLVTSASRAADPLRKAPASVTLIKHSELDAFADTSLMDALGATRGVFATDDFSYESAGLRGFSPFGTYGNRVQVQLDGHAVNGDWIGESFVGFDLLTDLDMVDRVEVVRGPGSVLHGTGAVHGVLGLMLREPSEQLRANASAAYVGWNAARVHADVGGGLSGGPSGWLAVGAMGGAPFDLRMPSYEGTEWAPDGVARGVGGFDAVSVLGKARWGDFSALAYANSHRQQFASAPFGTVLGDQRARAYDQRAFTELRWDPKLLQGVDLFTRLAVDYSGYQGGYPYDDLEFGVFRESYSGTWLTAEARSVITLIEGLRLTAGALGQSHPWNLEHGESSLPESWVALDESHPFHVGSLYANADWDPLAWVRVTAGFRVDGWLYEELGVADATTGPRGFGALSPRLAGILMPTDDDTVKLLLGSGFRAPSTFELTYNDGGFTQIRNPDLQPETVYTGELEYSRRLPADFTVLASLYGTVMFGLIEELGDATEDDPLRLINRDTPAFTAGAELELRHELMESFFVAAHYSFQRTRLTDLLEGEVIPNSPEHLGGLKLFTTALGRAAVLSTRVVAEYGRLDRDMALTEPVLVADATLSGDVEPLLNLHYALSVRNLLDWQYSHPVGLAVQEARLPQDGRTVYLELGFSL